MSTHGFILRRQRSVRQSTFFVLGGFLIALQLMLFSSPAALASPNQQLTSVTDLSQDVAHTGVSVVRLMVSYSDVKTPPDTKTPPATILCTGLGVLVASWPSAGNEANNWVLTDGALVNPKEASCLASHPPATLLSIQVSFSRLYNPTLPPSTVMPPPPVRCQNTTNCAAGAALFAFNTLRAQPFSDLAQKDTASAFGLGLQKEATTPGLPPAATNNPQDLMKYPQQIQAFLTPARVSISASTAKTTSEPGLPLLNTTGELTGMRLSSGTTLTTDDIRTFKSQQDELKTLPANTVHDDWNSGITAFYQQHQNATAHAAFQRAAQANPLFQAARDFAQATATGGVDENGKPGLLLPSGGITFAGMFFPYWELLTALAVCVLLLIVLLTSVTFGRAYMRRQREYAEAERRAAAEVQRIAEIEAVQHSWSSPSIPTVSGERPAVAASASQPAALELHCPRCGQAVSRQATSCPNCHLLLSPSESGLHFKVSPGSAASPPLVPANSLAEQPTLVPGSPLTGQPTLVPASSLAEQPTLEIPPGNGQIELEKTIPYTMKHLHGKRLSLAVGTRSDPGIKRKYKPNEDSVFAAQVAASENTLPAEFGLFVIADGMGGHANGQDASRQAIQTIIDFMLPKIAKGNELPSDALSQLLSEAVQHANQAVHQHNMELRADMGTTVTATLVVDTTAYVANVGDSRTYLYRASEGLQKITHDHSVVASLVEAGIIKPDDIYTHPKRNQIYRSLGEKPSVEVDSFTVQLRAGDKLLLCSDGLWDMVRDPKIETLLKNQTTDPAKTVDALIQAALDGGGEDNVSVIVVSVTENAARTLTSGLQLLAKPDSVQMPQL